MPQTLWGGTDMTPRIGRTSNPERIFFTGEDSGRTRLITLDAPEKLQLDGVYIHPYLKADDLNESNFRGVVGNKTMKINDEGYRILHDLMARAGAENSGYTESLILDNFNRFYKIWPDLEMPTSIASYVFITRPDLNIYVNGSSVSAKPNQLVEVNKYDPRFQYMNTDYPEILHMLTSEYSTDHDFIPFLQGRTESLQIPDYELNTHDFAIPYYNFKMPYPGVGNESRTGGQFDITFREDNRMRVFKMFDFWIYYIDAMLKDRIRASNENIRKNEMEYTCSIYQFLCDPTSERILFWSKYTGCFPYAIPVSNLSHSLHNSVDNKVSVSFKYAYVEHMDPMILTDFAYNTKFHDESYVEVYNEDLGMMGTSLVGIPVIHRSPDTMDYYLKWYARRDGISSKVMAKNDKAMREAVNRVMTDIRDDKLSDMQINRSTAAAGVTKAEVDAMNMRKIKAKNAVYDTIHPVTLDN